MVLGETEREIDIQCNFTVDIHAMIYYYRISVKLTISKANKCPIIHVAKINIVSGTS